MGAEGQTGGKAGGSMPGPCHEDWGASLQLPFSRGSWSSAPKTAHAGYKHKTKAALGHAEAASGHPESCTAGLGGPCVSGLVWPPLRRNPGLSSWAHAAKEPASGDHHLRVEQHVPSTWALPREAGSHHAKAYAGSAENGPCWEERGLDHGFCWEATKNAAASQLLGL